MPPFRAVSASILAVGLLLPGAVRAQTATVGPAAPGLAGPPRPMSRPAPSTGPGRAGSTLPEGKVKPLPKPTAAERADQKKLEHDLHICIGC